MYIVYTLLAPTLDTEEGLYHDTGAIPGVYV